MNNTGEFHLNLTLVENEVLCSMVRQATFTQVSDSVGGFRDSLKNHLQARFRPGPNPCEELLPEPSTERLVRELFNWVAVQARLVEDLRLAYRQGSTVVILGRAEFEALYAIQAKDWSRHDGSVEAMAFCMAAEACKIGIQAAFEAARIHLDRQVTPTNVFPLTARRAKN